MLYCVIIDLYNSIIQEPVELGRREKKKIIMMVCMWRIIVCCRLQAHCRLQRKSYSRSGGKGAARMTRLRYDTIYDVFTELCTMEMKRVGGDIRVDLKRTVCNAASTALSVSDIRLGGWQRVSLALPQSSLLLLSTFNRKIFFRPFFARPAVSLAARIAAVSLGSPTSCESVVVLGGVFR